MTDQPPRDPWWLRMCRSDLGKLGLLLMSALATSAMFHGFTIGEHMINQIQAVAAAPMHESPELAAWDRQQEEEWQL